MLRSMVLVCLFFSVASVSVTRLRAADHYSSPPRNGGIYVIAHRGAHQGIPENTLAAYQQAIDLGADFVEIDLRTTKDGQFVSIHNRTIDAYTIDGSRGQVRDFTLQQIRALDIGSRVGPEWKDERVPTFDEILELCKDRIGIYLDLKDAPVDQVAAKIQEHGMQRQVVWCESSHCGRDSSQLPRLHSHAGSGFRRHAAANAEVHPTENRGAGVERLFLHVFGQMSRGRSNCVCRRRHLGRRQLAAGTGLGSRRNSDRRSRRADSLPEETSRHTAVTLNQPKIDVTG